MNIILLSGGSGKRLWPLSNDIRSKQFIKIFKKEDGTVAPDASVTIATYKSQVSAIHNQLGGNVSISVEPCRRDTFAAIALATSYLHDVKGVDKDEAVVVCPVDPYVEDGYFRCVCDLYDAAKSGVSNLVLMGIKPAYPSEKYGYIIPSVSSGGTLQYSFTEKPDEAAAQTYIDAGALWNGGVFAYKLSYVLDKSRELLGTSEYDILFNNYGTLKKISFDYAVAEQEKSIHVIAYTGTWKDLGTWNTFTEAMEEPILGEVILSPDSSNVHILNELGIPLLAMGVHDLVISASAEGILVSDKHESSYIKPYVDKIRQPVRFAEKSWGSYRVLDVKDTSMTVSVTLNPSHEMNYHSHEHRDEVWTVVRGSGKTIVDGMEQTVRAGDVITMQAGCKHTVTAGEDGLQMIEVQLGESITVSDKKKYEMPVSVVST